MKELKIENKRYDDELEWSVEADMYKDIVDAEIGASKRIIHNVINEKRKLISRVLESGFFE